MNKSLKQDIATALIYLGEISTVNMSGADQAKLLFAVSVLSDTAKKYGAKPSGRAWTDVRREGVLKAAHKVVEFNNLNHNQINKLYDITVHEHENWDGEEVSVESVLTFMVARYVAVGLTPSRN